MTPYIKPYIMVLMLACTACMLALCACGSVNAEDALQQAENDLQTGNIEMVANSCDMLTDSASVLSSSQMCRVAIIYAKLSELSDNQDYMATATRCFERALSLDTVPGSLDTYIESLDVEDQSVVRVIREVSQALNSPCDLTDHDGEGDDQEAANSHALPRITIDSHLHIARI